ncbi:hypothetical protein E2C01_024012 [Portunus trituberculatus]|uniref:Uncharacterized protein n=1 Tax=Portunus trituberculatus TaxID=210409 RepID=A0A5B7ECQ3_PORTR|nr:hypothetical protein [Portunus trituberculatus]
MLVEVSYYGNILTVVGRHDAIQVINEVGINSALEGEDLVSLPQDNIYQGFKRVKGSRRTKQGSGGESTVGEEG